MRTSDATGSPSAAERAGISILPPRLLRFAVLVTYSMTFLLTAAMERVRESEFLSVSASATFTTTSADFISYAADASSME